VALTATGKPLDPEIRRAAGIAAWLPKPPREAALFNALLEALGDARRPAESSAGGTKKQRFFRILLVEDNPVNQRVAQLQLGKLGYTPHIAGSGAEALKAMEDHTFDLVFMDCQMPEMDGFEATAEVRRREGADHHTPIVAMTANALEGDREKCLAAGMDDYLSKPVDIAKLGEILARWDVTLEASVLDGLRALAEGETKLVRDVIEQYLKDSPPRIETIMKASAEGDAKTLERAAHALKGSSGNIGARSLWAICEKIEELARNNDVAGAAAPIGVLREEFDKLKEELEREKEK
jgi:CheY-like chemotaxis protein